MPSSRPPEGQAGSGVRGEAVWAAASPARLMPGGYETSFKKTSRVETELQKAFAGPSHSH